ncbi:hypothetical protein H1R20_g11110, partial [Candolleomyces eurysporus]
MERLVQLIKGEEPKVVSLDEEDDDDENVEADLHPLQGASSDKPKQEEEEEEDEDFRIEEI